VPGRGSAWSASRKHGHDRDPGHSYSIWARWAIAKEPRRTIASLRSSIPPSLCHIYPGISASLRQRTSTRSLIPVLSCPPPSSALVRSRPWAWLSYWLSERRELWVSESASGSSWRCGIVTQHPSSPLASSDSGGQINCWVTAQRPRATYASRRQSGKCLCPVRGRRS